MDVLLRIGNSSISPTGNLTVTSIRTHTSGMTHYMSNVALLVDPIEKMSHWTSGIDSYIFTSVERIRARDLGKLLIGLTSGVEFGSIQPRFARIFRLVVDITPETGTGRVGERRKVVPVVPLSGQSFIYL